MDRFDDMRTFVLVADLSSVSQAAKRLNKASSAVSRRLKDLESRLSTQLLTRTTRQIVLTDAGQLFYERAKIILSELEDAEASVRSENSGLEGTLRLTTPASFGTAYLSPVITAFMLENPTLNFDIDMTDRQVDLIAAGLDLALRIGKLQDSSLKSRRLAPIRVTVCASPAFLAEHGVPETPDDLARFPALCYSNSPSPTMWWYQSNSGESGRVRVNPRLLASSGEVIAQAAVAGIGIACEPTFIVGPELSAGTLVPVLQDYSWFDMALYVVYPSTSFLPNRTRAFIDYLVKEFGETPVWEEYL